MKQGAGRNRVEGSLEFEKAHVLVAEDDPMSRDLFNDILSTVCQVSLAADGRRCLDMLREEQYDLVLLDVMMPQVNGWTVLKEIRNNPEYADHVEVPVIFISALSEPGDIVKGLGLGATDYVPKPIQPTVLLARVRTHLKVKRLMDERRAHIETLERTEVMRTRLTRIASHDLKNPLNNMRILQVLLLRLTQPEQDEQRRLLKSLDANITSMQHVIDTFLDMVALETDSLRLRRERFSWRDAVLASMMQYEVAAEEKAIKLTPGDLAGEVTGDQERTTQVVNNLISNALKYSPRETTVRLWTEVVGERTRLHIADQGPGIPEEERHLLFKEFSQLSPRPTAGEPSTGLGLWIVQTLMLRQGGDAGATFPQSGGSVFWVELPTATTD